MPENAPPAGGRKHFYWQCQKCGHIEVAKSAPLRCPACAAPQQEFVLLEHD
jgi:rubrerythrin